jgi:alkanesulfonate monooxygenase SsuD/methylene tetrahydromethanopterin reductase-like flavin-dependent oxidoreductase (luciferase family)
MADFGLQGFPIGAHEVGSLESYGRILEMLPEEFSTVWVEDHVQLGNAPKMEAWTLLTYLAAAFPRFRYGHMVLNQSFRNPALLAKMAASLQALTDGRFILGIGAGWREEEYRAYGYAYPRGGIRVAQLAEAIQVMRAMWTDSPASFHGAHYTIDGAYCEPRPAKPIPIMVGTNGPRALGVAAQLADWWNWDAPWEDTYRQPYETLRGHCEEIGRPFEEIVLTAGLTVDLPEDASAFEPTYEHPFYPGTVFPVLGPTPADVIAEIERLVDIGVSHFQVSPEDLGTLERFVTDVVPHVRLTPR